jgi:hypothetical protein
MVVIASTSEEAIIELRLPPAERFASALRVLAASLAAEEQFTIDDIADLRTAVDETFAALVRNMEPSGPAGRPDGLIVRFRVHGAGVDVTFRATNGFPRTVLDLRTTHLLETKVDRLVVGDDSITLVKRPRRAGAVTPSPLATAATREPG